MTQFLQYFALLVMMVVTSRDSLAHAMEELEPTFPVNGAVTRAYSQDMGPVTYNVTEYANGVTYFYRSDDLEGAMFNGKFYSPPWHKLRHDMEYYLGN